MTGYLFITGLLFFIVGLRALVKPVAAVATPFELSVGGTDGMNYLRSGTGGVTIACGLLMIAACWVMRLEFPALVLAVTVLGGLLFGRIVSAIVDGSPGPIVWISGFFELMGLVFGGWWIWAGDY
jgi:hypothetical protein